MTYTEYENSPESQIEFVHIKDRLRQIDLEYTEEYGFTKIMRLYQTKDPFKFTLNYKEMHDITDLDLPKELLKYSIVKDV